MSNHTLNKMQIGSKLPGNSTHQKEKRYIDQDFQEAERTKHSTETATTTQHQIAPPTNVNK